MQQPAFIHRPTPAIDRGIGPLRVGIPRLGTADKILRREHSLAAGGAV
ncbi:MAG: hypothetical protein U0587_20575 [Candidatus Binatia bacterium]